MEELKKRKLDDANGETLSQDQLRSLLDPLAKPQLVDLLARLCVYCFFNLSPFHPSEFCSFMYMSIVGT